MTLEDLKNEVVAQIEGEWPEQFHGFDRYSDNFWCGEFELMVERENDQTIEFEGVVQMHWDNDTNWYESVEIASVIKMELWDDTEMEIIKKY